MAIINVANKALTVNPLKQSQALGASLAFLGLKGTIPLFHGSQGCTAFAKVVLWTFPGSYSFSYHSYD